MLVDIFCLCEDAAFDENGTLTLSRFFDRWGIERFPSTPKWKMCIRFIVGQEEPESIAFKVMNGRQEVASGIVFNECPKGLPFYCTYFIEGLELRMDKPGIANLRVESNGEVLSHTLISIYQANS